MDPASTFKLKIWSSSPNCRKDSSYAIIKYIDKDTTNYKDFVDEFTEEHPMGLKESLKLSEQGKGQYEQGRSRKKLKRRNQIKGQQ
jgi:hypothetical protein